MNDKKESKKIIVFIDGSNLYHIIKALFPGKKPNDFNFEKFVKYLVDDRDLIRTYYYNVPLDMTKDLQGYMKQQKFFDKIQKIPNVRNANLMSISEHPKNHTRP